MEVPNGTVPQQKLDEQKELKLKFVLPSKKVKKEEDEYTATLSPNNTAQQEVMSDDNLSNDELSTNEMEEATNQESPTKDDYEREISVETETCLVGKEQFTLPLSLIELGDLSSVLTMEVWQDVLSADERASLSTLLPPATSEAQQNELLTALFNGDNFNFGNPVEEAARALNAGELQDQVVRKMDQLKYAQRSEYIHNLRLYHLKMVDYIIAFRRRLGLEDTAQINVYVNNKRKASKIASSKLSTPLKANGGAPAVSQASGMTTNVIVNGFPIDSGGFSSTLTGMPLASITPNTINLAPKLPQITSVNSPTTITYIKQQPDEPAAPVEQKRKKAPKVEEGAQMQTRAINLAPAAVPSTPTTPAEGVAEGEAPKQRKRKQATPGEKEKKPKAPKKTKVKAEGEEGTPAPKASKPRKMKAVPAPVTAEEVDSPVKAEQEEVVEAPSGPPAQPFLLFTTIRDYFENNSFIASLDAMVAQVESVSLLLTHLPPFFELAEFVRIALLFLAKPPVLSSAAQNSQTPGGGSGTGITYEDPITRYDKITQKWQWLDVGRIRLCGNAGDEHLHSLEQLFYFATARNLTAIDGGVDLSITMNRQQKCILTIESSSDDMVEAFQVQEAERYKVPEKAFVYTINNFKYIVAPMKRGVGNPGNKPREHFLLKPDRPPHINLLCLVRDAAARLPGGVGTRPDVSLLLRDSQYVVESTTDTQINTVVSGALDRLHSEKDPCVKFDSEQKLWVYLHRHRTVADFSTTKSRKRTGRKKAEDKEKESTQSTTTPLKQSTPLNTSGPTSPFALNSPPQSSSHSPLQHTQPQPRTRVDPLLLETTQQQTIPQLPQPHNHQHQLPAILSHVREPQQQQQPKRPISPLQILRQQLSPPTVQQQQQQLRLQPLQHQPTLSPTLSSLNIQPPNLPTLQALIQPQPTSSPQQRSPLFQPIPPAQQPL